MGHLQFHLEVREDSQPPQQHLRLSDVGIIDRESVEAIDFHPIEMLRTGTNLPNAFVYAKQRLFVRVSHHSYDYIVKKLATSLDNVEVSECNRIEAAGIDC